MRRSLHPRALLKKKSGRSTSGEFWVSVLGAGRAGSGLRPAQPQRRAARGVSGATVRWAECQRFRFNRAGERRGPMMMPTCQPI